MCVCVVFLLIIKVNEKKTLSNGEISASDDSAAHRITALFTYNNGGKQLNIFRLSSAKG